MLCDPSTFVPVQEKRLLWDVLEKDAVFVEIPETFRDVRIAGNKSFGKGQTFCSELGQAAAASCECFEGVERFWWTLNTLKGWKDFGGLRAAPVSWLDETLGANWAPLLGQC